MKNRYVVLTLSSLFLLIVSIQIYAINEPGRMESAAENVRTIYVSEGAGLYVDYCAECHGSSGEGSDMMPRLNRPALADADTRILFQVLARAAHGTSMAAWHEEEGQASCWP